MLRLYLLRHGKSDWSAAYGDDHERPLAARGLEAARTVGVFLARAGEVPERVLSSTARRAHQTAELAIEAGRWGVDLELESRFYGGAPAEVLERVGERVGDAESVLVVGHQPNWAGIVERLTGARVRFPTAACARIDLAASSWQAVGAGGGSLRWLVPPKLLARLGVLERGLST